MKKILIVMEAWGEGGTETYVAGLVQVLQKRGFDVSLFLLRSGSESKIRFISKEQVIVGGFSRLWRLLNKHRFDVISLHLYTHLLPVVLLGRIMGAYVVSTLHTTIDAWGRRHRAYWRIAINLSAKVVAVSWAGVKSVKSRRVLGYPISGGVGEEFFECSKRHVDNDAKFRIIAIGRHSPEKDWSTLIGAVHELPESLKANLVLTFCGAGSLTRQLKEEAEWKNVDTEFLGHVDKENLIRVLETSDLSVLPSRFEGLPISILESMAAGVPAVVSNFQSAGEIINNNINGHIFNIGDLYGLSKLLAWHMLNRKLSSEIGKNGREFILQNFSQDKVLYQYVKLFEGEF